MRRILTTLCLLLCVSAWAGDQRAAVRVAADGVDVDTNQKWSTMPQDLYDDCVLWMPFSKEKVAGTYYDYSTSKNDGAQATVNSRPSIQTGNGGSYDFDGVDDYISINNTLATGMGSGWTFAAWIRPDHVTNNTAIAANMEGDTGTSTDRQGIVLNQIGDEIRILQYDDGTFFGRTTSGNELAADTWKHIAATWDGDGFASSNLKIYINGVQTDDADVNSGSPDSWNANSEPMKVGVHRIATGLGQFFNGDIDDVRIFTTDLSAPQLLSIFNNTKATFGL